MSNSKALDHWEEIRTGKGWVDIHPTWEVRMIRKGEMHMPGDFRISALGNGHALYTHFSGKVDQTGDFFRYVNVSLHEITTFVSPQVKASIL